MAIIVSKQIQPPVESVYLFHTVIFLNHIIFPHLCGVNFLLYAMNLFTGALFSLIYYEQWSALCVIYSGWCSVLGVVSCAGLAVSGQRFWRQIRFDRAA